MYHKIIISFSFCSEGYADIVYIGIIIYHSFRQSLSLNQFILNVKSKNSAKNWDCTMHKAWCDFEWHINMWIMNKSHGRRSIYSCCSTCICTYCTEIWISHTLANSHIIKLSNSNLQCRLEIFRENTHDTLQLVFFS